MADNDILSLAKLLGARNITDNPFAKSPLGLKYIAQNNATNDADALLKNAQTPLGSLSAGIASYIQHKREREVADQLGQQLQDQATAQEQKRASLANSLGVPDSLDYDVLKDIATKKYQPVDQGRQLDIQNKQLQNQKLQQDISGIKPGKPLPPTVLKLQNEELDTIGTLGGINADLAGVKNQIDSGKLPLGPIENIKSRVKNKLGMSDEGSQNYATFKATLEKQRNDSLRLNKGVQTEGDAVRAWNELFSDINDPNLVSKRLSEIQKINERAVDLKRLNVDQLRANYGAEPLDYSNYNNRPAAIGKSGGMMQTSNGVKFKVIK